jgi:5-(carboxyamino)imidazole ribonucleotide synthase
MVQIDRVTKRVGVIGGGQLAWMMGPGAEALGVELQVQTPTATDPAVAIATRTVIAPLEDAEATIRLASQCDVITFENEFVDLSALQPLADRGISFFPTLKTLSYLLDKYEQRCYLRHIGLPTPDFLALTDLATYDPPVSPFQKGSASLISPNPFGFPVVLKARRHGYDGKGTSVIQDATTLKTIVAQKGADPFLLEAFVPFDRELAVIAARSIYGEVAVYPIVETQQEEQVCRAVIAPAQLNSTIAQTIKEIVHTLLTKLDAVGVFGIELFLTAEGKVLVNEIAPRTHNSGHYTLDACYTSQFEQHLRAICGFPLEDPNLRCAGAVMVNLLGYETANRDYQQQRQQLMEIPSTQVYWYGKTASHPGRKLGHVTVLLENASQLERENLIGLVDRINGIWHQHSRDQGSLELRI